MKNISSFPLSRILYQKFLIKKNQLYLIMQTNKPIGLSLSRDPHSNTYVRDFKIDFSWLADRILDFVV